jgi:hypothetical protein
MFPVYNFRGICTYIQYLSILFPLYIISQFALVFDPLPVIPFILLSNPLYHQGQSIVFCFSPLVTGQTAELVLFRSLPPWTDRQSKGGATSSTAPFVVMCLTFHFSNRKIQSSPAGMECGCCPEFLMGQRDATPCTLYPPPLCHLQPPPLCILLQTSSRLSMYFASPFFGLDIHVLPWKYQIFNLFCIHLVRISIWRFVSNHTNVNLNLGKGKVVPVLN